MRSSVEKYYFFIIVLLLKGRQHIATIADLSTTQFIRTWTGDLFVIFKRVVGVNALPELASYRHFIWRDVVLIRTWIAFDAFESLPDERTEAYFLPTLAEGGYIFYIFFLEITREVVGCGRGRRRFRSKWKFIAESEAGGAFVVCGWQ